LEKIIYDCVGEFQEEGVFGLQMGDLTKIEESFLNLEKREILMGECIIKLA